MPEVTTRRGPAAAPVAEPRPLWELTPAQERDLMAQALARVQEVPADVAEGGSDPAAGGADAR